MPLDEFPNRTPGKLRPFVWPVLPSVQPKQTGPLEKSLSRPVVLHGEAGRIIMSKNNSEENREVGIGLKTEDEIVRVSCSRQTFNSCVQTLFPDKIFPPNLSQETQLLVIEHVFLEYLFVLEQGIKEKIELCSGFSEDIAKYQISVESKSLGHHKFWLRCSLEFIQKIKTGFDWNHEEDQKDTRIDTALHIPLSLYGPKIQISSSEFNHLLIGDTLMFSRGVQHTLPQFIAYQARQIANVTEKNGVIMVSEKPVFKDRKKSGSVTQGNTGGDIDALPVTVQLELSRTHIPLGDLRKLTTGSIVSFDTPLPENIRLFVGEKCFAEGLLMQIDDNIAVRITKIE